MANVLQNILDELSHIAKRNERRAYDILGAAPGPGNDIRIEPAAWPIDGTWRADGITLAGDAFMKKFYLDPHFTNRTLASFKRHLEEWGLKYEFHMKYERIGDGE